MFQLEGYDIRSVVHSGSSSRVFRGTRRRDGRPVVIKIPVGAPQSPERRERLRAELDLGSRVSGPGTVSYLALEPCPEGLALVMDDFGGASLDAQIPETGMPIARALGVAVDLAERLGRLHKASCLHLDVKPANILVDPADGSVRICDFDLSTTMGFAAESIEALRLQGTLLYISPEQTGRTNQPIDERSDLYSFGATLYEMFTGAPPFEGEDDLALVHNHLARRPVSPRSRRPEIPEPVSDIVLKLLAKSPGDRYATARGARHDLQRCADAWATAPEITPFPLGERDLSSRLLFPDRFYGREHEAETLRAAFEEAASGSPQLTLVHGWSGIGKSTLVQQLQRPVLERGGSFCSGKFDQLARNTPYSAVIHAVRGLIRDILTEGQARVDAWRARILEALGPNGALLVDVIPELAAIIGPQPAPPALGPAETRERFRWLSQGFIAALTPAERPVVMFLDDLQWADDASLKLLQDLVTERRARHLCLVGAYRDNEVGPGHPLTLVIAAMEQACPVRHLALTPLGRADASALIADILHHDPAEGSDLVAVVHEKTQGNPFFLRELLRALHNEQLLVFDEAEERWTWDVPGIEAKGFSDNVVDLLVTEIGRVGPATQRALGIAACIGNHFDADTLALVAETDKAALSAQLGEALGRGFILAAASMKVTGAGADGVHATSVSFRFAHDRVQQAAYSLVAAEERPRLHARIGWLLLRSLTPDEREERAFEIVNHLNYLAGRVDDPAERAELLELNRAVARRAQAANAWVTAMTYLETAFSLLGPRPWEERYAAALENRQTYAEAACFGGRYDEAGAAIEDVLSRARDVLDKVPAFRARAWALGARNRMTEALTTVLGALALLGIDLPLKPSTAKIVVGLLVTKWRLRGKDSGALLDLPRMKDPRILAAMTLLGTSISLSFVASPNLFPLLCFEMVRLSLAHGNCPASINGYDGCAIVFSGALGDVVAAEMLDGVCRRLVDALDAPASLPQVLLCRGVFIIPLRRHLRETLEPLFDAYRTGIDLGDAESASTSIDGRAWHVLMAGLPLEEALATFEDALARVEHLGHQANAQDMRLGAQFCRNLLGRAEDSRVIKGADHDADAALAADVEAGHSQPIATGTFVKGWLAFVHRDLPRAYELCRTTDAMAEALMGTIYVPAVHFVHALIRLQMDRGLAPAERRRSRRAVNKSLKALVKCAADAPMNHAHRVELVLAERARLAGRFAEATAHYDRSIALAREHQYLHEEATAHELAGRFCLERGQTRAAAAYLTEARRTLVAWNGWLKIRQLDGELGSLLGVAPMLPGPEGIAAPKPVVSESSRRSSSRAGWSLDLATVLKASQALSEEIVLEALLHKLIRMLIQNAGAEWGVLLGEKDGELVVEVESRADGAELAEPGGGARLPEAVLSYVVRTKESVVLHDAALEERFAQDPYVALRRPRSVLCAPLMNQGKLIAVVYMENNLTAGAFTADRLEVLRLLSAQAALSIHNARLYANLEEKVAARTRELQAKNEQLRRTQTQLVAQEKLASLGALTAGIAHELRNPLNFVTNFAELNTQLAGDLAANLDGQRDRLDPDTIADVDEILGDLRQNTARIDEHGRRATKIIDGMLLHSRSKGGSYEATDLNALLVGSLDLARHGMRARESRFNVAVRIELDDSLGAVDVIAADLGRAFLNVIANACYATHEKKQKRGEGYAPEISLRTVDRGERVEIRIGDNGTGIPGDVVEKIYEPFFTTKPSGEGTGLGLSISHDIVVGEHRGEIRVETTIGEHTEFVITLPKRAAAA